MAGHTESSAWLESATGARTPVRGSCFLGRSASCEVVLGDAKASRQHALVQGQEASEFWLIDLGSANGTYLNGRRVSQPCRLSDGDQITVASTAFTFRRPSGPSPVGSDSTSRDATIQEIRSLNCWLLIADIQGSTQLFLNRPSADTPVLTERWLAACRKILDQHGGTINKYLGDGFLAYWVADPKATTGVIKSLGALKSLQESSSPPFRLVLHYGRVSLGGAASLGEESLAGSEVNFAFRVEKLAATLGVSRLLTEPAHGELKSLLPATPEGRHSVSGFEGEFAVFSF